MKTKKYFHTFDRLKLQSYDYKTMYFLYKSKSLITTFNKKKQQLYFFCIWRFLLFHLVLLRLASLNLNTTKALDL